MARFIERGGQTSEVERNLGRLPESVDGSATHAGESRPPHGEEGDAEQDESAERHAERRHCRRRCRRCVVADDLIRVVAREHKAALLHFIMQRCNAFAEEHGLDARQAEALARQWLVLVDGAIGVALVSGCADAAGDAQAVARQLLDFAASSPHPPASKPKRASTSNQEKRHVR